jgi:hypothetical protein
MKKIMTLLLCLVCFVATPIAQETAAPQREFGIRIQQLNFVNSEFSLVYKTMKAENKFHRFRAAFGNLDFDTSPEPNRYGLGIGANYGVETRAPLSGRFLFCRGPEFGLNAFLQVNDGAPNFGQINLFAGYVLGVQYNASAAFFLNLELIPGLQVGFTNRLSGDPNKTTVNGSLFFASLGALTAGFRF